MGHSYIFQLITTDLFEWLKSERSWKKFPCIEINWLLLKVCSPGWGKNTFKFSIQFKLLQKVRDLIMFRVESTVFSMDSNIADNISMEIIII